MKDEPFKISAAVSDDIPRIAQLERLCFSEPWSVQSLTACCKNPEYIFFTAKDKNENIAGYCSMRYVLNEAEICNVAVDAKYRRMGAASALVREIIKTACELHLKSISLEVRESNEAAISLYEKFGSVSYTHLDVYKRQIMLSCVFFPITPTGKSTLTGGS